MTVDTSNHVHLLLNNVNGQVAHWVDTMPGTPPGFVYTPAGGFTGTGLSAGPASDPRVRMLLTDPQGDVLTLALNADNSGAASPVFPDLPGLVPVNLSMDGYNVGRLLWSKTTGDNLIQNLLPDNSTSTLTAMTAGHLASTGLTSGYDGDGLRAWKQNDAGQRTYFLYDGTDPVCELDAGGTVSAVNTFGATGLLSRRVTGGASVFYTFDERGNVAQRTDAGANVLSSDLYDGYGKKMAGPSDVWGYGAQAGYYTDAETGLVLCTHRFYDPQTGRFITRDPMGYGGGVNLYGYTGNDPINEVDPDGLAPIPGVTKPPIPVPGDPTNDWKWNPNPTYPTKGRPGKWTPTKPIPGRGGGQPGASWDSQGSGKGIPHWDVDDGLGDRKRYDEKGNPLTNKQAHGFSKNPPPPDDRIYEDPALNNLLWNILTGGLRGLIPLPGRNPMPGRFPVPGGCPVPVGGR